VYLHKHRYYSLMHTKTIWYSLLLLGCKHVQHVIVLNTVLLEILTALYLVTKTHIRVRVTIVDAETKTKKQTDFVRFLTSTRSFSLVQIIPIGY